MQLRLRNRFFRSMLLATCSLFLWDISSVEAVFRPITASVVSTALITSVNPGSYVAAEHFKRENGGTRSATSHAVNMSSGNIARPEAIRTGFFTSMGNGGKSRTSP